MSNQLPYGLWPSPVSPLSVGASIRLDETMFDRQTGALFWTEGRSGLTSIFARSGSDAPRLISADLVVRGGVGYGGGEFDAQGGEIVFAERSGRLYRVSLQGGLPAPITPAFGAAASPAISPDQRWVLYVHSDGQTDVLAAVDLAGRQWPVLLARGADFYMQPTWHTSGRLIAWIEWDHPNMPWNNTRLMLGRVDTNGPLPRLSSSECLLDAAEGALLTAVQPRFSPDGRYLSCIVTRGEWDELRLYDLANKTWRTILFGENLVLAQPAWGQGARSYGWDRGSQSLYFINYFGAEAHLAVLDAGSGEVKPVDTSPYTWIDHLSIHPHKNELVFTASSPHTPERIVRWDGAAMHIEARSQGEAIPAGYLGEPRLIHFPTVDGIDVSGWYTPPSNPEAVGSGLPPAFVYIHGGPTSAVPKKYDSQRVYFTSRGYAWLDVNYRGSSLFGRSFQDRLNKAWGPADSEDAASAAHALAEQGLADPQRLIIIGGSAGGFTVLNTLIHYPGLYKAGVCLYGVSDLFALNMDTHKFELRYNDSLVGLLPEDAPFFHRWSAVFHAAAIRDPLAVFQGSEDKVVPPAQSEEIVAQLRRNGVAHIYRLYEGEGHGFRRSENIVDYLQQTERFVQKHVLFAA